MSRKLAWLSELAIKGITLFSNNRQKRRTLARLINKFSEDDLSTIDCPTGQIKINHLRSPHVASAAENFFKDEPETLKWIDTFKEGQIFFDVGAGIGVYSLYAALIPSVRVYSFEPNGMSFGLLVEHIRINGMSRKISPFCIALGQKIEKEWLLFNQALEGAGGSSFSTEFYRRHGRDREPSFSQAILSFSLDGFLEIFSINPPDHIKIDVDGLEPKILSGARLALSHAESIMLEVENWTPDQVKSDIELPLKRLGFEESLEFKDFGSGRNRLFRKRNQRTI